MEATGYVPCSLPPPQHSVVITVACLRCSCGSTPISVSLPTSTSCLCTASACRTTCAVTWRCARRVHSTSTPHVCSHLPVVPLAQWQVCAALGKLPGQSETYVVFSKAPSELHPGVTSSKPFGQCRGWRDTRGGCEGGYATDDIFFLEVCVFNQICSNGAELWQLDAGVLWRCHMNATRFRVLQAMLTAEPDWSEPRGLLPRCESWCNAWTCAHRSCAGCGAEVHASRQLGCP